MFAQIQLFTQKIKTESCRVKVLVVEIKPEKGQSKTQKKSTNFFEERAEQPEEKEEERGRRKGRGEDGRPLKSSTSS